MSVCSQKRAIFRMLVTKRSASRNCGCHFAGRKDGRPQSIYHAVFINKPMVLLLVGVIPFWIPNCCGERNHIRFEKSYLVKIRCINFHSFGNSSAHWSHMPSFSINSFVEIVFQQISQVKSWFSNSASSYGFIYILLLVGPLGLEPRTTRL